LTPPKPPKPIALTTRTPAQTAAVGQAIGRVAQVGDVIALYGPLGAGKTQLVRGLAEGLGLDPAAVSSPTFVLVQEYDAPAPPPGTGVPRGSPAPAGESSRAAGGSAGGTAGAVLVHIDAYRLEGGADLASIGWEGTADELREQAVVAVEWADQLGEAIGPDRLEIELAHAVAGRTLTLTCRGRWVDRSARLAEAVRAALADAGDAPRAYPTERPGPHSIP